MANPLRELFDSKKLYAEEPGVISVLVSLKSTPDETCLASLEMGGLCVKTINANKLTGDISPQHIAKLEQHDAVVHVERSVRLKPTDVSKRDA